MRKSNYIFVGSWERGLLSGTDVVEDSAVLNETATQQQKPLKCRCKESCSLKRNYQEQNII